MAGDKDRDREKESKDKEPKEKEKKRHRRLSIRRRARKSSEGLVKQPLTPIEIDWDQCVLYSYSIENMKLKKISESDLKIENIIGRHRYGMVRSHEEFPLLDPTNILLTDLSSQMAIEGICAKNIP